MKLISWNINGLRAILKKNFFEYLEKENPDIIGIQEIKLQEVQIPELLEDISSYHVYWNFAKKKGYSGVALLTKIKPNSITYSIGEDRFDNEGRVIIADYDEFTLINCYFPNGEMSNERLQYKLDFNDKIFEIISNIRNTGKNIIICGDFNTAHKPIDLKNPKENKNNSGFLPIERLWLDKLVANNYIDTFRYFDKRDNQYSWWSYRFGARPRNIGWRIDYFFVNKSFIVNVKKAFIQQEIMGSDHCPLGIEINL